MRKSTNKVLFLFAILLVVLSSCNKRTQLLYINNISNENLKTPKIPDYLLKPGDVLYIQIITQDPNVSSVFNNRGMGNAMQSGMFGSDEANYLYGYSVSDSGLVQLPVLGKLKIADLTINQCRDLVQKQTEKYLKDGIAVVKLLSFKVTILGEVKRPGVFTNLRITLQFLKG